MGMEWQRTTMERAKKYGGGTHSTGGTAASKWMIAGSTVLDRANQRTSTMAIIYPHVTCVFHVRCIPAADEEMRFSAEDSRGIPLGALTRCCSAVCTNVETFDSMGVWIVLGLSIVLWAGGRFGREFGLFRERAVYALDMQ